MELFLFLIFHNINVIFIISITLYEYILASIYSRYISNAFTIGYTHSRGKSPIIDPLLIPTPS